MVRKRHHKQPRGPRESTAAHTDSKPEKRGKRRSTDKHEKTTKQADEMARSKWLVLAIASGAFAATNGLFAKLTTTTLTTSISGGISHFLSLPSGADKAVEYITRGIFFLFNILSNIIMWALFTRALTASPSTTKVAITNTSANFLVTALLGMIVFGERVAGLWWLGAAAMGAGCILVGMREEKGKDREPSSGADSSSSRRRTSSGGGEEGEEEETAILLEGLDEEEDLS